ncbi:hypothetical protein [Celerinatantimonas diazotrophica]|uniref:hypothetical protein n=1 Tax=Celerinatantimonas diazotrophica TaxID=412034 RepID=UPI00104A668C|nr:hypothetical protein CEDIAZO_02223 [Celerinatantimonas diazotrophica]
MSTPLTVLPQLQPKPAAEASAPWQGSCEFILLQELSCQRIIIMACESPRSTKAVEVITTVSSAIISMVYTADDTDTTTFPLNQPVFTHPYEKRFKPRR